MHSLRTDATVMQPSGDSAAAAHRAAPTEHVQGHVCLAIAAVLLLAAALWWRRESGAGHRSGRGLPRRHPRRPGA